MSWDFETDPEFQKELDWIDLFVKEEVEPLDALWGEKVYERPMDPVLARIIAPLKERVRQQRLQRSDGGLIRSVDDHNEFDLLVRLIEHAPDRAQHQFRPIPGRDHNGNQRHL